MPEPEEASSFNEGPSQEVEPTPPTTEVGEEFGSIAMTGSGVEASQPSDVDSTAGQPPAEPGSDRVDEEKAMEMAYAAKDLRDKAAVERDPLQERERTLRMGRAWTDYPAEVRQQHAQELDSKAAEIEDGVSKWVDILREHPLTEEMRRELPDLEALGLVQKENLAKEQIKKAEEIEAQAPSIAEDLVKNGYRMSFYFGKAPSQPLPFEAGLTDEEQDKRKKDYEIDYVEHREPDGRIYPFIDRSPELRQRLDAIIAEPSASLQDLKDFYAEVIIDTFASEPRARAKEITDSLDKVRGGGESPSAKAEPQTPVTAPTVYR